MQSAHDFDDNVDILIIDDAFKIIRQKRHIYILPRLLNIAHKYLLEDNVLADTFGKLARVHSQNFRNARADRTGAEERDMNRIFHVELSFICGDQDCPRTSKRFTPSTMRILSRSASRSMERFAVSMEIVALATPCNGIP